MNWKKISLLIFLGLMLPFLDVAYFSALPVYGATLITTFVLIINFALLTSPQDSNEFVLFEFLAMIFFAVFSSVPIWILFAAFIILPNLIVFFRKNYFSFSSVPLSSIFFLAANFIFEFLLLLSAGEWSREGFLALLSFVIINSIFGVFVFFISNKLVNKKSAEIKI